jgi:ABC-type uncharacterized transport system
MTINSKLKANWGRLAPVFAVIFLMLLLWGFWSSDEPKTRPILGLSTTLPLYWGEGDIGDVMVRSATPLPAYERLNAQYDIRLMDDFQASKLKPIRQMILAQPRALSPSEFAAIDEWVRGGGHLLLLADPALQWESIYPLGDKRRPLFTSLLSPLLAHWGLELELPLGGDENAMRVIDVKDLAIRTATPGAWHAKSGEVQNCVIAADAIMARCKIGKGSATLIADADLLNAPLWQGTGVRVLLGHDDFDNIKWVQALLQRH